MGHSNPPTLLSRVLKILTDTTDGYSCELAYGWAFQHPIRKVYYNLTITIMSVLVAFVISGVEFLQVISSELSWTGDFWVWLNALDFETLGFGIVALFLIAWLTSIAYYRHKGFENEYYVQLDEICAKPTLE